MSSLGTVLTHQYPVSQQPQALCLLYSLFRADLACSDILLTPFTALSYSSDNTVFNLRAGFSAGLCKSSSGLGIDVNSGANYFFTTIPSDGERC